ncbi:hypothetical protein Vretimale_11338 [Volvox reticuliferus]|uniref:Uncharacterized protein n=2 Tax=Volvox reticuliferus TaxID=1737510 RepID=A0A8J4GHU8_9CHLO|nr:hypothetical protein Vretimale_11338 [Volvox reticuliferus]
MGLARVLLGRGSKETRLDKCTRIDSLGLARRRLAAKAAQAELSADGGSLEGIGRDDDGVAAEPGLLEQDLQDAISLNFLGRRHKDSLRIHRRRFKMRASLDLPSSRLAEKNASWIVGELPSLSVEPDAQDENADDDNEDGNGDDDGDEPQNGRISCVVNTNHHVRFRRASDGEYLTSTRVHRAQEGGIPNAFKAVQLKAERLLKRLTGNYMESHPSRPRSATTSRHGSPTRAQRISAGRAASTTTRAFSAWGLGLRHRSGDASGDVVCSEELSPTGVPSVITAGTASTGGAGEDGKHDAARQRRFKRQSAPGELFFTSISGLQEPASPPLVTVDRLRTRSVTKGESISGLGAAGPCTGPGGNASKSRNWLARLSRGFAGTSAYKASATSGNTVTAAPAGSAMPSSIPLGGYSTEDVAVLTEEAVAPLVPIAAAAGN